MNYELITEQNGFGQAPHSIATSLPFEIKDSEITEASTEDYEIYGRSVLSEISRIKNVAPEEARRFVDFSTFDEIVECLRAGKSSMGEWDPGRLAMTFCHISTQ